MLSCSDLNSAQKLSQSIHNSAVIATDNSVKLFSDGTVEGGTWYRIEGESKIEVANSTPPKSTTNKDEFIRLVDELARTGDVLLDSIVKNGNKVEYTNLAGKLLMVRTVRK